LSRDIETFIGTSAAGCFDGRAVVNTARCGGDLLRDVTAVQQLEIQLGCLVQLSRQSCLEREYVGVEKDNVLKRIEADGKQPNVVRLIGRWFPSSSSSFPTQDVRPSALFQLSAV